MVDELKIEDVSRLSYETKPTDMEKLGKTDERTSGVFQNFFGNVSKNIKSFFKYVGQKIQTHENKEEPLVITRVDRPPQAVISSTRLKKHEPPSSPPPHPPRTSSNPPVTIATKPTSQRNSAMYGTKSDEPQILKRSRPLPPVPQKAGVEPKKEFSSRSPVARMEVEAEHTHVGERLPSQAITKGVSNSAAMYEAIQTQAGVSIGWKSQVQKIPNADLVMKVQDEVEGLLAFKLILDRKDALKKEKGGDVLLSEVPKDEFKKKAQGANIFSVLMNDEINAMRKAKNFYRMGDTEFLQNALTKTIESCRERKSLSEANQMFSDLIGEKYGKPSFLKADSKKYFIAQAEEYFKSLGFA
jgi:hypothetical protein